MSKQQLKNSFLASTNNFKKMMDIINGFPGISYWVNKEGMYLGHSVFSNKDLQTYKIPSNLVGKSISDIFPKDVTKYYMDCIIEVIGSDMEVVKNNTYSTKGEKLEDVLYYNKPLKDENEKIIGAVGSIVDINFVKKTARALLTTNDSLNKQTKAMQEIYYNSQNSLEEPLKEILLLINYIEAKTVNNNSKDLIVEMKNYLKILLDNSNDILKNIY